MPGIGRINKVNPAEPQLRERGFQVLLHLVGMLGAKLAKCRGFQFDVHGRIFGDGAHDHQ